MRGSHRRSHSSPSTRSVRLRSGVPRVEGGHAPDNGRAIAQMGGGARRGPGDRPREYRHQAVPEGRIGATQGLELAASGIVEFYEYHTSLYAPPRVKTNPGQVISVLMSA